MNRTSSVPEPRVLSCGVARLASSVLAGLALAAVAAPARGDVPACIAHHDTAGDLRDQGKLLQARELLSQCTADAACPNIVRESCSSEAVDLSRVIPSITFSASVDGNDVVDVKVSLDGAERTTHLDGRSLELDPGEHVATFAVPDGRTQSVPFVLAEGQRLRAVNAQFHTQLSTRARPGSPARDAPRPSSARTAATYAFGGAAVVSFSAFGWFALHGNSQLRALDLCKPACARADYDSMKKSYLAADIGLGVGIAATAATLYLLLSSPSPSDAAKSRSLAQLSFIGSSNGVLATVRGHY